MAGFRDFWWRVRDKSASMLPSRDADYHFIREYRRLVRGFMATHPLDEAMSLAVGGNYAELGERQKDILLTLGLSNGDGLLDLGCGSGRLASALGRSIELDYVGVDIIPELLTYARSKTPDHFVFIENRDLKIPRKTGRVDMVCAFSLCTHLKHEETYAYLEECTRVLKKERLICFSFIEFSERAHWPIFLESLSEAKVKGRGIANVFIERSTIDIWAERLGFAAPNYISPGEDSPGGRLGQSIAYMRLR